MIYCKKKFSTWKDLQTNEAEGNETDRNQT